MGGRKGAWGEGVRRHAVEELLVVRKLLFQDIRLDRFLDEVSAVGFPD